MVEEAGIEKAGVERVWDGAKRAVKWQGGVRESAVSGPAASGDEALDRAAAWLEAGGIVAHPTSTVYGLGGRPRPDVDARIAAIKGRAPGPLIHLGASREVLAEALPHARWTGAAEQLADAFWPGPLTLVVDDGTPTGLAVRVDPHPVLRRLLERAGGLMTSTSLNVTEGTPARTSREARRTLSELDASGVMLGWLDAGDLRESAPSTLVRACGETVEIIREGAVPAEAVRALQR